MTITCDYINLFFENIIKKTQKNENQQPKNIYRNVTQKRDN